MALRLKSNPAPRSGALFVSNPRKRKPVRKSRAVKKLRVVRKRKNTAKKRVVRKNVAKKRVVRKRKNPIRAKKRKSVAKKRVVRKRKVTSRKRKNPIRKRKSVAKKRIVRKRKNVMRKRKNVMRKRKNGTRKGMARKSARRAFMKNPKRKTRIIRKNPMSLAFLKPIENLVSKVPFIGKKVAPYAQPAVIAMIGGAGVVGGMMSVGKLPVVGQYAKYPFGNAFGATVMGLGLAVISAFLPVKPATKKALALSFASAGGAINAGQLMMCGFDLDACKQQNLTMLGADADADYDEDMMAINEMGLGDGGYYEVEPLSGISIQSQPDMAGIDYDNAQYGDANVCPSDLSPIEGEMAMRGREAFMSRFGTAPKRMAGQKRNTSVLAGKRGHRWGWLIKSLGWQRFSQLAQLPPQQRRKLIAKLKASAIQASQATFDRELTGGLGGLSYSGGISMDMSGLSVDNMAGIAIAGAGI